MASDAEARWDPRAALDRIVLDTLRAVIPAGAFLYFLSAGLGFAGIQPVTPVQLAMLVASGVMALAFVLLQRRGSIRASDAHPISAAFVAIAFLNVALSYYASPSLLSFTGFTIVLLASSLLFLSIPWFIGSILVAWASLSVAATLRPDAATLVATSVSLITSSAIAVVVVLARRRTTLGFIESQDRYQKLFEGVPVGIYRTTPDGKLLDVNGQAARFLRFPDREALLRATATSVYVDPNERAKWQREIETHGAVNGYEYQIHAADGSRLWIRDSARAIRDASGKVIAYEGAFEDVTARHLVEDKLEETRRHVARSEKLTALGTLVAGVAHEINNPLTYMRGNTEVVQFIMQDMAARGDLTPEQKADIEEAMRLSTTVISGIDRVAQITRSLKVVARAPKRDRKREDMNALVESVLTVGMSRAKGDVAVESDLRATHPVLVNSSEITQVLLNLVFNALEAVGAEPGATVRVRTRDDGADAIVVEIEDNGPGIPREEQFKLFTPFHTTKPDGTGLGLSVSFGIVENHGGTIAVRSDRGEGATFVVRLPTAAVAALAPAAAAAERTVAESRITANGTIAVREAGFEPADP